MNKPAFIFQKLETRIPYYALMKLEEEKIFALETVAQKRIKCSRIDFNSFQVKHLPFFENK